MENTTNPEETKTPETQAAPATTVETNPVVELTKQYEDLNDRYLRLVAEFDNYKKRSKREAETTIRYANETFARDMLDVLDNFERALKSDDTGLRAGLEQIHKLYLSVLARNGVKPMNAEGCAFDPTLHEAVAHIPSDTAEGTIVDEPILGYMMHDKVLRHAKVAVSRGNE